MPTLSTGADLHGGRAPDRHAAGVVAPTELALLMVGRAAQRDGASIGVQVGNGQARRLRDAGAGGRVVEQAPVHWCRFA